MMFLGGRKRFLDQLRDTGEAKVSLTGTDDLVVATDAVQAAARERDLHVRMFVDGTVRVRADEPDVWVAAR